MRPNRPNRQRNKASATTAINTTTDRCPDGSADVGPTTHEADGFQRGHDVMLGGVGLEMKLDRGVAGELDCADADAFWADVHLFDDTRQ